MYSLQQKPVFVECIVIGSNCLIIPLQRSVYQTQVWTLKLNEKQTFQTFLDCSFSK